jgi:hypothetical protein
MARSRRKCPKCKSPLFFETTRRWGPRLWCLCGFSQELGGTRPDSDEIKLAKVLLGSIDRNLDKLGK